MTISTNPLDSIVYIDSIVSQTVTATSIATLHQTGSGVLISPDEVLTAAYVVFGPSGQLLTNTQISPGYNNSTARNGSYSESGVHVSSAYQPTTNGLESVNSTGVGLDFAIIHLATPVTNVPIFQLGSGFTNGALDLTGYPAGTDGNQNTLQTSATVLPGANVLQAVGQPGNGGDPHGASGGPGWTTVNGKPTVVGVIDTAYGSNTALNQLTSPEIQQILGWVAQDDAGKPWAPPVVVDPNGASVVAANGAPSSKPITASIPSVPQVSSSDRLHQVADPIIAAISNDASNAARPFLVGTALQAAAALQSNINSVGSSYFDDLVTAAFGSIDDGSATGNRAGAYLEGLMIGHDGGSNAGLFRQIANAVGGIFSGGQGTKAAAMAGFQEGQAMKGVQATAATSTTASQNSQGASVVGGPAGGIDPNVFGMNPYATGRFASSDVSLHDHK